MFFGGRTYVEVHKNIKGGGSKYTNMCDANNRGNLLGSKLELKEIFLFVE